MKEIYDDVIEKMRNHESIGDCLETVKDITGMDADNWRLARFMSTGSSLVYEHFFTIADGLSFTGIVNVDRIASVSVLEALQISMTLGYLFGAKSAEECLDEKFSIKEYEETIGLFLALMKGHDLFSKDD